MFLVSSNRDENYSVLTYAKLALRNDPDLVVIYSQKGDHAEARKFVEQTGADVFMTELPLNEGLQESIALKEVSPARYDYFMKSLTSDSNSQVPRVSQHLLNKSKRKVAFIPGDMIAREPTKKRSLRTL